MKYRSTRDPARRIALSQALVEGLAPDGGLHVPERIPAIDRQSFRGETTVQSVAPLALAPYFEGDVLAGELAAIARDAFSFPVPLSEVSSGDEACSLLELFHGPTAAFKDLGARFLAACLARVPDPDPAPRTVLVATSGDTGGAVAAAFHGRARFRVVLLYPAGRVSPLQERQLCGWGGNVRSFAVRGSFDDCQRLAKSAFADATLRERMRLTSANSINVGRLLPQLVSYAAASLALSSGGGETSFVIPSGNLGHAVACVWARAMGFPVGTVLLAHNANRAVVDWLSGGSWHARRAIATIANAMDVGDPSNRERLLDHLPDPSAPAGRLAGASIADDEIRACIRAEHARSGRVLCPHSAVAMAAWRALPAGERRKSRWVVVATAHPGKFPEIVEPLIGRPVPPPDALGELARRPMEREDLEPDLAQLRDRLLAA